MPPTIGTSKYVSSRVSVATPMPMPMHAVVGFSSGLLPGQSEPISVPSAIGERQRRA